MDVGKKGVRFKDIENKIYRFYLKKGYPPDQAREIARRTAGKIFWQKFPGQQGARIISQARKKRR